MASTVWCFLNRPTALARAEGQDQGPKVREDQREEAVDLCGGALPGPARRVRDLPELLPLAPLRGEARLRVPAPTRQKSVPPAGILVRLRFRLERHERGEKGWLGITIPYDEVCSRLN